LQPVPSVTYVPRKPLDAEIAGSRRRRDRLAATLAAEEQRLAALLDAQRTLLAALSLHSADHGINLSSNMQVNASDKGRRVRISAGRARIESPSRNAAIAANLTDLMIAELVGASRAAVQKWHTGNMAIPRRHAERLAKRGIPLSAWTKIRD
jgi:hypothetical protein